MVQLPVIVKRDVRDKFESPKGKLQQQLARLKGEIGYPVTCRVDWALMWTECEPHFEDKSTFVPYVESQVLALCDALEQKLEDESSPWTEQLLEKTKVVEELQVQVQATQEQQSSVHFLNKQALILTVACQRTNLTSSTAQLVQSLDAVFTAVDSKSVPDEDEDWTGFSTPVSSHANNHPILTPTISTFSFPSQRQDSVLSKPTPLPTLATLARPDILFAISTPSYIHIHSQAFSHQPRIIIQSTHEPSLRLIYDYFTKWSRADPQTRERVPLLRYTLGISALGPGFGGGHHTLLVEPFSQVSARSGSVLNASLFVAFVEGVLGYQVVHRGGDGEFWECMRSVAFG